MRILVSLGLTCAIGWLGQWSFIASWIRALNDWWVTGDFTAYPRLILPTNQIEFLYGLTWRDAFSRPINYSDLGFQTGFGLALLFVVIFGLANTLKGRSGVSNETVG